MCKVRIYLPMDIFLVLFLIISSLLKTILYFIIFYCHFYSLNCHYSHFYFSFFTVFYFNLIINCYDYFPLIDRLIHVTNFLLNHLNALTHCLKFLFIIFYLQTLSLICHSISPANQHLM